MTSYSFSMTCGRAFDHEDPVLSDIKGLFATKRKQKKHQEMYETASGIFSRYDIKVKKGIFGGGFNLTIDADNLEAAEETIGEAVGEIKNWYNVEFGQEQEFDYK